MEVRYFETPEAFGKWLAENHDNQTELWVGYYKKSTGHPSITWPESVEQALCFGWIDGLRKSIDEQRYKIRFTPRKKNSHWSDVNIRNVEELKKKGLMKPAGLRLYENRSEKRSRKASYEQENVALPEKYLDQLYANKKAAVYFKSLTKTQSKNSIWWIISAKREETRQKRLKVLIDSCAEQQLIPPLRYGKKK